MKRETQQSISAWGDAIFGPISSNARAASRVNEEMAELLKYLTTDDHHPRAAEEMADILIILYRLAEHMGVDLHIAVDQKMSINRFKRVWVQDGSGHGYHTKAT